MALYSEKYFETEGGLKIYYRDYPGENSSALPLLCLHGLTRNSRDFEPMIEELGNRYRYIVPDMRGRGNSGYDADPHNYNVMKYVEDVWALMSAASIKKFLLVGTSMGGIMSLIMAAEQPERIGGILLNDIGPELGEVGLGQIFGYLGKQMTEPSWEAARLAVQERLGDSYPSFADDQWVSMAFRQYTEQEDGSVYLAYDAGIRIPFLEAAEPMDLWPIFIKIDVPLLCVHGALSGLLTIKIAREMRKKNHNCIVITIDSVGHTPILDEQISVIAIRDWLTECGQ